MARLVVSFLFLSLVTVSLVVYFAYERASAALKQSVFARLDAVATLKEDELNHWVEDHRQAVEWIAQLPEVKYQADVLLKLKKTSPQYQFTYGVLLDYLSSMAASKPDLQEIFILRDMGGEIVISTDKTHEGEYRVSDRYFTMGREATFVQNVYHSPVTGKPTMTIATPLFYREGQRIGVLAAHLSLKSMDQIILKRACLGETGETYLVDGLNMFVTPERFKSADFARGVHTEGIDAAVQGLNGYGQYRNYAGVPVIGVYRWIEDRELALLAEMRQEEALAPARQLAWTIVLIGLASAGVLAVGIYLLARQITRPILAIIETARLVSAGDLTQRAPVLTTDEIGVLAQAFNTMQTKLRQSYQHLEEYAHTLEERVIERTWEVKRRATQIATGAEVARAATALLDQDQLIARVVELIQERFGFYYVGLFLLDEENRYAVLRQGSGEPGRIMKERGHRLEIGGHSMVGWACAHKRARIALDVGEDPVHFANPLLPETHSEMALPLCVGERVLGALTIQSTAVAAFDESDVAALQGMVDQVAVALENARLFQETQDALHTTKALYKAAWDIAGAGQIKEICQNLASHFNNMIQADRTLILLVDQHRKEITVRVGYGNLTEELSITYEEAIAGITGQVLQSGQPILSLSANDELEPAKTRAQRKRTRAGALIVAPLVIQGQVSGTVTVVNRVDQRKFTHQDVELLMTLTTLATTAIENVRLFEETQQANVTLARRAVQLETSSQVGQQATSILDLDELLTKVVNLIKERFGYYFVGVSLLSDKKDFVVLRAGTGEAGETLRARGFRVPLSAPSIVARVCATGECRTVDDVSKDPEYVALDVLPDTRSELALPLRMGEQIIGALDIQCIEPAAFGPEDKMGLQNLADQISIAIRNAQLYKLEQERRQLAESLEQIGRTLSSSLDMREVPSIILEQLGIVVPYERGAVIVQQNDKMQIIAQRGFPDSERAMKLSIPIREGDVFQQVVAARRPVIVDDVTQISGWRQVEWLPLDRSWMGVPLVSKGHIIGMISLTRRAAAAFSPAEAPLAATFAGQAAIALENARLFDEIRKSTEQLEQRVQQRTAELHKAYRTLEQLDKNKSDFINITAHELRTPLTVIKGYAQMLEVSPVAKNGSVPQTFLAGILDGADRLNRIVDGMLDIATIDTQTLNMRRVPTKLADIISEVRMSFTATLRERELALITTGLDDLPVVLADSDLLYKIFYHLIINAIKYTPDGGTITIDGMAVTDEKMGRAVEIVVRDTGIGIDPEHQELIFEKFYQTGDIAAHSSGRTKFKGGGPGLGLAIAKGGVVAHGGKIWVESAGHDEQTYPGSHFHVRLPVK